LGAAPTGPLAAAVPQWAATPGDGDTRRSAHPAMYARIAIPHLAVPLPSQPAPVEGVVLSHEDRTPIPRLGSPRFAEIRPPDLASSDHQYPRIDRACAVRSAGASSLESSIKV